MSDKAIKIVAQTFLDLAGALETGHLGKKPVIALTGLGSEHGESNTMAGAEAAQAAGVEVVYIGSVTSQTVRCIHAADEQQAHAEMERLLAAK